MEQMPLAKRKVLGAINTTKSTTCSVPTMCQALFKLFYIGFLISYSNAPQDIVYHSHYTNEETEGWQSSMPIVIQLTTI